MAYLNSQKTPPSPPRAQTPGAPMVAPPSAPQRMQPPAPAPAPEPEEHGSSTMAVDASAFGMGGPGAPGMPPSSTPPFAPQRPPQAPSPQSPPQQPYPMNEPTSGVASTMAVDISAFGLGGPGQPGAGAARGETG